MTLALTSAARVQLPPPFEERLLQVKHFQVRVEHSNSFYADDCVDLELVITIDDRVFAFVFEDAVLCCRSKYVAWCHVWCRDVAIEGRQHEVLQRTFDPSDVYAVVTERNMRHVLIGTQLQSGAHTWRVQVGVRCKKFGSQRTMVYALWKCSEFRAGLDDALVNDGLKRVFPRLFVGY